MGLSARTQIFPHLCGCCCLHLLRSERFFEHVLRAWAFCDSASKSSISRTEKPTDRYGYADPLRSLCALHPSGTVDRWPGAFFGNVVSARDLFWHVTGGSWSGSPCRGEEGVVTASCTDTSRL